MQKRKVNLGGNLMRFGRKMTISILAILLCMAFVFNFGSTFSLVSYNFLGKSKNSSASAESYTEYATVTNASGEYVFANGSVNNKLSIDYGTSAEYDLMVKFTASYKNSSHKAKDFDFNFVDRNKWCVDLPTTSTLTVNGVEAQTVYSLSSTSNQISGVMYYLGKISGAGSIDLISGITFYASALESDNYYGDILSVTFTSYYVKSNSNNYNLSSSSSKHSFYSNSLSGTNYVAYDNWISYMKSTNGYIGTSTAMVYNAYANDSYALSYPKDFTWTEDFNLASQTEPSYSNSAYRYKIAKTSSGNVRTLEAVISGNKYRGGLGVFVMPSQKLRINVNVLAYWEKDGVIQGTMPNNTIHLGVSDKLDDSLYSKYITKPTYIDVLDYIMLTAEARYRDILINNYKLVICKLSVTFENATTGTEINQPTYKVNNSTSQSPVLARYKDIVASNMTADVKTSVSNIGTNPLKINSFTVTGKLWYAGYTVTAVEGETSIQVFEEMIKGYLSSSNFKYDTDLWTASASGDAVTFTAKSGGFNAYVSSGYEMPLITGVIIPNQSGDLSGLVDVGDEIYVYDLWCSLEISITSYTEVTSYTSSGAYTGVEVVTNAYNSTISANSYSYIYVRNNTNQTITAVNLSNFALAQVSSASGNPRNNMNASASFSYELMAFGGKGQYVTSTGSLSTSAPSTNPSSSTNLTVSSLSVNIKPNDYVLLFRIKPSQNAIVYSYNISVQMASGNTNLPTMLKCDDAQGSYLINNSATKYEFRIKSNVDLSSYLANSSEYVLNQSGSNYFAYYVGVINENQIISITKKLEGKASITVEVLEHVKGAEASQYVASNYTSWTPPTQWLTQMQNIYKVLDDSAMS